MRKKEVCYGSFALYIMADKALIANDADTPMHLSMTVEPIEVFDYNIRDEFISFVKKAVARGIPKVEMPPEEELYWDKNGMPGLKAPPELKYAKVNTWDELERKTVYYSVECYERGYVVISCGRNKNGLWSDMTALELRMPAEVGLEGVVDAILQNLRTRSDLPAGFTLGPSQEKTVKGV